MTMAVWSEFPCFVLLIFSTMIVLSRQQTTNCTKAPMMRCDRQCGAISWSTCKEEVNEISHTERDLQREANANLPLRLALNISMQRQQQAENIARNLSDVHVQLHEVYLLMAYTQDALANTSLAFYEDINADIKQNGISGGQYPVAKFILRDVLVRIGLARPLKHKTLYRYEPPSALLKYEEYLKNKQEFTFEKFTSVSIKQDVYGCNASFIRLEIVDFRAAVNMRQFSPYPQEQEVLFPPFYNSAFVKSIDNKRNLVTLSGPGTEQNFPKCSAASRIGYNVLFFAVGFVLSCYRLFE